MTRSDIDRFDKEDMYGAVRDFPEQLRDGRQRALDQVEKTVSLQGRLYDGVVVAGMGGSAIGGDFLRALSVDTASMPIVVNRSYLLPGWVSARSLVIASSYSGNTEETLMAFDKAAARGASLLCIATGGTLKQRAAAAGVPVIDLLPGLQPRAALSYSAAALLTASSALGLVRINDSDWDEAVQILQSQRTAWEDPTRKDNAALLLAQKLRPLFPVIYSSEQLEVANLRWRNQMHENAKTFAVGNLLPEMNHNEIMGWARFGTELSKLGVVVLRDREDHPRTRRRLQVTAALLKGHAGHWEEVSSVGSSRLARILSLMYRSDWVSLFLAICHETDPSPVGLISTLKERLATG